MTDYRTLKENFRKETIDTLLLISSKDEQLDYQRKVPIANVSAELFCSWESCYQDVKEQHWYQDIFSDEEFEAIEEFDHEFETVCSITDQELPYIEEFVKTKEWTQLSTAAKVALNKLCAT